MSLTSSDDSLHIFSDDEEQAVLESVAALTATLPLALNAQPHYQGRQNKTTNFRRGTCKWYADYLNDHPVYPPSRFRQVFRIPLRMYCILHDELVAFEPKLQRRLNGGGIPGHSSHQNILGTLRKLATGLSFEQMDDIIRMSVESQCYYFSIVLRTVFERFGPLYLNRKPTLHELRSIEKEYSEAGFPGCVGCIYCIHLHWKNCPKLLKGQYHNPKDGKLATISYEALCDRKLYCWHWFPGRCGTNSDITMVHNSPLLIDILSGNRQMVLPEGSTVNGTTRNGSLYYPFDGIYPRWAIFVGQNHAPINERELNMTKAQESTRKDIERLFRALQARFKVLRHEMFEWSDKLIILISQVCVILHNMLVDIDCWGELEDKENLEGLGASLVEEFGDETEQEAQKHTPNPAFTHKFQQPNVGLASLLDTHDILTSEDQHVHLVQALTQILWSQTGANR